MRRRRWKLDIHTRRKCVNQWCLRRKRHRCTSLPWKRVCDYPLSLSFSLFLRFCVSSGCVDPAYGNPGGLLHLLRRGLTGIKGRVTRIIFFFRRVIPRNCASTRAVRSACRRLSCITVYLRTCEWTVDWMKLVLQTRCSRERFLTSSGISRQPPVVIFL